MARRRDKTAICPLCQKTHEVHPKEYLYAMKPHEGINEVAWIGYKTVFYCTNQAATVRIWKLYNEQYQYVGYEAWWCGDTEIPF